MRNVTLMTQARFAKQGEFEWGTPFAMNPGKTYLTEEQYAEMIEKIKAAL